jgi:putative DNA primase/helicase
MSTTTTSTAQTADGYHKRRGWTPIAVPYKTKKPIRKGWQKLTYEPDTFKERVNIGVLLGTPSGNLVDVDLDCREAIRIADAFLDPTDSAFGRKSAPLSHWLYTTDPLPATKKFKDPSYEDDDERATLVELRSTGTQTIMPGSMHVSGEAIEWSSDGEPALIHGDILRDQVSQLAAAALLARYWKEGRRHDMSLALAGGLLNAGWSVERVEGFILSVAHAAGDEEADDRVTNVQTTQDRITSDQSFTGWPTLAELTDDKIVKRVREWLGITRLESSFISSNGHHPTEQAVDPDTGEVVNRPLTDLGNSERFRDDHKGRARYVHEERRWFVYARTHWREDTNGAARRMAMKTVRSIYAEAAKVADDRRREKTAQWAHKSEAAKAIREMLSLAGDLTEIATDRLDFDHGRFLLNLANGTYNLQTGKLEDHDPANMITRISKGAYDPDATSELWESFLADVTGEPDPWDPMRTYLKRAAGSCLAGWSGDEVVYFTYGPTQTGKSTFLEAIRAPLGSYVAALNFDSLLNASTSTPRPDLVAVVGARILVSNEMDRAQRHGDVQLAASLIKRLTSGEPIRVRNNYSNGFDWTPDAVLWLAANDAPEIAHDDEAMWRRMHRIPFNHQHRNADKTIRKRLTSDPEHQAAILTWLIEGWHEYQQHGIEVPDAVKQSTEEYRSEQNPMTEFVASSCTLDAAARVPVADLNQAYERWCQEQRLEPVDGRIRNAALQSLGCRQGQARIDGRNKKTWSGIRLKELWD